MKNKNAQRFVGLWGERLEHKQAQQIEMCSMVIGKTKSLLNH